VAFAIVAIDPRTGPTQPAAPPWFVPYSTAVGVGHGVASIACRGNGRPFAPYISSLDFCDRSERQSLAAGVDQVDCATIAGSGVPPAPKLWFGPPFSPSLALIVAHKPVSVSEMVRTRARGLDRHCPHGVSHFFQITSHKSEPCRRARNLLSKDRWRASLRDEVSEVRPQMPLVSKPALLACAGERLARTASSPNFSMIGPTRET
jgi:hypothetical protein